MKKITFLFFLLTASLGFSQTELLTNGDFSNGVTDWAFTGGAVVANEAAYTTTGAGGNPWDTQLVYAGLSFVNAQEYTLTFDARADAARDITVAIQNVGIWSDQFRQDFSLTTTMATYTATFNATSTNTNVQLGFLMAGFGVTDGVYYDNVSLTSNAAPSCSDGVQNQDETGVDCGGTCPNTCPLPPTTIVAAPARPALDVLSVFGPAYSDVSPSGVQDFADANFVNYTVETADDTRELTTPTAGGGAQYQYFFGNGTGLDLTNFTTIHLDSWVLNAGGPDSVIRIILQNFDTTTGGFQHNLEATIDVNTPGVETWNTVDIELADFSNPTLARNNIQQIQIVAQGAVFGPTYLTNFYFHKNTVLGVDDFSINDLKVSPNPTNDSWNIEGANTTIDSIEVYDILGKRVQILNPNSQQATIDASGLKTGLYLAKLYSGNAVKTIKLVKN